MARFNEYLIGLKKFKEREGHCDVPFGYKTDDGFSLDVWVLHQRKHSSKLKPEHYEQLNTLGFIWDVWEERFGQLKQFYEQEAHIKVPDGYKVNGFKLARWVEIQRENQSLLSVDQIDQLNALGDWDLWEEGLTYLEEFHQSKGHCNVSAGLMQNRFHLGTWAKLQRNNQFVLSADRVEKLQTLGFIWDVWEETFEHLKQFHAREGHCNVPVRYSVNGFQLGRWVRFQRENQNVLSEGQIERLDALSFEYKKPINAYNDHLWLTELLLVTANNEWCVEMNCTTCGAGPFRKALKECLDPASESYRLSDRMHLTIDEALLTLNGLNQLGDGQSLSVPGNDRDSVLDQHRKTIMLILYQCWIALADKTAHGQMQAILEDTLAGTVLNEMIAHYTKHHIFSRY